MRARAAAIVLMGLLFCGVCTLENAAVKARPNVRGEQISSIYALAGEFRTVFANLLWIKADEYHHEFLQHERDWSKNRELAGLLDLIIVLDPGFVEAYADRAYIYADGDNDPRKALRILKQGISNNPRSRELYELTAIIYARRLRLPKLGIPYARKAVLCAEDGWYRTRAGRLLRTIQSMAANSGRDTGLISAPSP